MILGGVLAFLRSHEPAGGDTIDHNATVPEPWEIRYAKTGQPSNKAVMAFMEELLMKSSNKSNAFFVRCFFNELLSQLCKVERRRTET